MTWWIHAWISVCEDPLKRPSFGEPFLPAKPRGRYNDNIRIVKESYCDVHIGSVKKKAELNVLNAVWYIYPNHNGFTVHSEKRPDLVMGGKL